MPKGRNQESLGPLSWDVFSMKRMLMIVAFFCCAFAARADLPLSTNAVLAFFETSYDTSQLRFHGDYEKAALYFYYWTNNIQCYNDSRSGGSIQEANEMRLERRGLAEWANGSQYWIIIAADDNGDYSSNDFVANITNTLNAPGLLFNGSTYTNEGGWAAAHAGQIKTIVIGAIPADTYNGDPTEEIRNDAATNTGTVLGYMGVDNWYSLWLGDASGSWSNDFASGNDFVHWYPESHPGAPGQLTMAVVNLRAWIDTNVNSCVLDWDGGSASYTNHCVVSSSGRTNGTFTFTWKADRHSMPYDVPDGTITNDATDGFKLIPSMTNAFFEIIRITNAPVGNYVVNEDGSNILAVSSDQLAAGINFFTVTNGAMWAQRKELLGRIRDMHYCDRVSLLDGSAGDQEGEVSYDSYAQGYWDIGSRGDNLISNLAPRIANLNGYLALIHAAAIPTNHVFTITKVGQTITFPSPGDQTYGVDPLTLNATASSGLPVTYSVTSGPATVSSNLLTITNVGQVTIQASQPGDSNSPPATPVSQTINVAQKTLTPDVMVADKTYDGTSIATVIDPGVTGVVGTDDVALAVGPATFSDKNAGTAKTVTVTALSLIGPDAGKYSLDSTDATTTASILVSALTVSGITATDKIYNGDTTATVDASGAVLNGIISPDVVTLSGAAIGTFADPNVGAGKPVAISGLTLDGADAGNYQLTEPIATASIAAASTWTSVASSANPSASPNVTFTATVTAAPPGGGIATGNVVFLDGPTALATNTLSGATASFSLTDLSHGSHIITAEYCGDGNFFGSTNSLNQLIDTPPTTTTMVVQRYPGGGVLIRSSDLLTNDSDPDGDGVSLVSVNPTGDFGGTITNQGKWICYQPLPGFTNSDSFSYVVADDFGLQTTGVVAIAVQTDDSTAQNFSRIGDAGNDVIVVRFFGIPQRIYTVQYTTDTNSPDWQTLGTATASNNGVIQFFDSPPANSPPRVYRTTYP